MADSRFDRLYIFKIGDNEIDRLRQLCEDYGINDNGTLEKAVSFHRIWGISPAGLIYLSFGMAEKGFDFNSIEELEAYLDKFVVKN